MSERDKVHRFGDDVTPYVREIASRIREAVGRTLREEPADEDRAVEATVREIVRDVNTRYVNATKRMDEIEDRVQHLYDSRDEDLQAQQEMERRVEKVEGRVRNLEGHALAVNEVLAPAPSTPHDSAVPDPEGCHKRDEEKVRRIEAEKAQSEPDGMPEPVGQAWWRADVTLPVVKRVDGKAGAPELRTTDPLYSHPTVRSLVTARERAEKQRERSLDQFAALLDRAGRAEKQRDAVREELAPLVPASERPNELPTHDLAKLAADTLHETQQRAERAERERGEYKRMYRNRDGRLEEARERVQELEGEAETLRTGHLWFQRARALSKKVDRLQHQLDARPQVTEPMVREALKGIERYERFGELEITIAERLNEVLQKATPRPGGGKPEPCASCGADGVRVDEVKQEFQYGEGDSAVTLTAAVPAHYCDACGARYTDHVGEERRAEAVRRHLEEQDTSDSGEHEPKKCQAEATVGGMRFHCLLPNGHDGWHEGSGSCCGREVRVRFDGPAVVKEPAESLNSERAGKAGLDSGTQRAGCPDCQAMSEHSIHLCARHLREALSAPEQVWCTTCGAWHPGDSIHATLPYAIPESVVRRACEALAEPTPDAPAPSEERVEGVTRYAEDDEVVGRGHFHLERMDDGHVWLNLGGEAFDLEAAGRIAIIPQTPVTITRTNPPESPSE